MFPQGQEVDGILGEEAEDSGSVSVCSEGQLKVALALIPELSNDGKGQDAQYPGWSQGPSPGI